MYIRKFALYYCFLHAARDGRKPHPAEYYEDEKDNDQTTDLDMSAND